MTGEELKDRRESIGLTQTEMAAYLGVNFRTYTNWEQSRRKLGVAQSFLVAYAIKQANEALDGGKDLPLNWRRKMEEESTRGN